jgi:hypothetical protein
VERFSFDLKIAPDTIPQIRSVPAKPAHAASDLLKGSTDLAS